LFGIMLSSHPLESSPLLSVAVLGGDRKQPDTNHLTAEGRTPMSELEQIRDTHYKGISDNDLDLATSVFAEDVETTTPLGVMQGLAAFRQFGEAFAAAAPDATIRAIRTFESGDTIISEGSYSGTHTGDLVGPAGTIPATGRSFSFPFVDIMQVTDGKVASHRIYWDMMGFMAQLGVQPQ
jgi:steroid delta-isomerase-like uncharacterized protein